MEPGMFHIPQSTQESPATPDTFGIVRTPEIPEQLGRHMYDKMIEEKIEQLRETANELTVPRYLISRVFSGKSSPDDVYRKNIDAEAEIGGNQLAAQPGVTQRFFYLEGRWYLEQVDQQGAMHASYELTRDELYKIVNGRLSHLAEGEAQNLYMNIPVYYRNVAELYGQPHDETLIEKALAKTRQSNYDLAA